MKLYYYITILLLSLPVETFSCQLPALDDEDDQEEVQVCSDFSNCCSHNYHSLYHHPYERTDRQAKEKSK